MDFDPFLRWLALPVLVAIYAAVRSRTRWGAKDRQRKYEQEYARLRGDGIPHERADSIARSLSAR